MPTALDKLAGRAREAADVPLRGPIARRVAGSPRPSAREEIARAERRVRETARRFAHLDQSR